MYHSNTLRQTDRETFVLQIEKDKDFKILQLTDLHLGFGVLSRRKDRLALDCIRKIIKKVKPDLIVLTGDSIFPFLPRSGTLNNGKQAKKLMAFLDGFQIPMMKARFIYSTISIVDFLPFRKSAYSNKEDSITDSVFKVSISLSNSALK